MRYETIRVDVSDNGMVVRTDTTIGTFLVGLNLEFAVTSASFEPFRPVDPTD